MLVRARHPEIEEIQMCSDKAVFAGSIPIPGTQAVWIAQDALSGVDNLFWTKNNDNRVAWAVFER